jgi:hypothetical protein
MNDERLDQLIADVQGRFRVPPAAPLDEIWDRISEQRRQDTSSRGGSRFTMWWRLTGLAAAIGISFTLGRASVARPSGDAGTPAPPSATVAAGEQPVAAAATQLLGETVVLLSALPDERAQPAEDDRFARQAGELLVTTRLLIDSRVAERDPALKSLLQDLELVLAQLARLRNGESRAELDIITDALQQQDIVPRIRSVAAGLNAGAD